MGTRVNISGKKFGMLTAIKLTQQYPSKWECICDCGNIKSIYLNALKAGATKSCGCIKTTYKGSYIEQNDGSVKIPLTHGHYAIIDREDVKLISYTQWYARKGSSGKGYYALSSNKIRMHRIIINAKHGDIVDHINGDGLDNRKSNLRICTQQENLMNINRSRRSECLKGAYKHRNKYMSRIFCKGNDKYLGLFDTEIEAHKAYLVAYKELAGNFMSLEMQKNYKKYITNDI